jgi:hypothetical protein
MVGQARPDNTTCNRQQLLWMAQGLGGFENLSEEIGRVNAELIADLIFDKQVEQTNPDGRYILIPAGERPAYPARIDGFLQAECTQIRDKRAYVDKLLEAAMAGLLRGALAEMTEPETHYVLPRKHRRNAPPIRAAELEIMKAADWVARSLQDDGKNAVLESLTRHVLTAPAGVALGRTPQLLDQIHAEVVRDPPRVRSPNSTTTYPSSVGGRFLLELIFKWTSTATWPAPGDAQWQDAALFYMGAVATVQGYPDGNKRAGRMAYAVTLLKGKHPFIAPNPALERALIRM